MSVNCTTKSRAEAFISNFCELENFFKEQLRDQKIPFYSALAKLSEKNPVIECYKKKLQSYAYLRNLIIHDEKYPIRIIAEPHEDVVNEFANIVKAIKQPKKVGECCSKNLRIFNHSDSISDALRYMKINSYSQLVVKLQNGYSLLTAESITCWLEDNLDEPLDLNQVSIEMVMSRQPDMQCHDWIPRNASLFDAHELFTRQFDKTTGRKDVTYHLYALIVTENGLEKEKPLGLFTPWDLLKNAE